MSPTVLASQSALSLGDRYKPNEAREPKSVSPNNEWVVGAQITSKFVGGGFADNLIGSGLVRYDIPINTTREIKLPVFSNLATLVAAGLNEKTSADSLKSAASALLSSSEGISVGLYPYWVRKNRALNNFRVTSFAQLLTKVNTLPGRSSLTAPDTAQKVDHTLLQGRAAFGVEFAIGEGTEAAPKKPLTVSLTGALSGFNPRTYELVFGEHRSTLASFEVSAVIPVSSNAGILIENIAAQRHAGVVRVGLLIFAGKGSGQTTTGAGTGTNLATATNEEKSTCRGKAKTANSTLTDDTVDKSVEFADCLRLINKKP